MKNPFRGAVLVVLLVLSFLYTDLSIFGVGLPFLLVVYLCVTGILAALASDKPISSIGFRKGVVPITLAYIAYSLCFAAALYDSGSLAVDIRYWISHFLQFLWFPAIYLACRYKPVSFSARLRLSVAISAVILVGFLVLGVVASGDILTLRNGSSFISADSANLIIPDILDNANRASRSALLLLFLSMVFQFVFLRGQFSRLFWRVMTVSLSIFITLSLSRACILGMLVLWIVYILMIMSQGKRSARIRILLAIVVSLSCVASAAVLVPSIGDRLEQGMTSVVQARDGYQNDYVQVRDMTIRARTWAASMLIIRDNPVSGVGVSEALETLGKYGAVANKDGEERPIWVHGGFLKVALYGGFLALIPMILFLFRMGYAFSLLPKALGNSDMTMKQFSWLGIGYFIAIVPVNIGADSFGYSMTWFTFATILSIMSFRRTIAL